MTDNSHPHPEQPKEDTLIEKLKQATATVNEQSKTDTQIELSKYTEALLATIESIQPKMKPDDISKISVSQTVSFLAIVYEKMRNAVEYREEHLVRRAAIERIIKRRLALNGDGQGEAENLLRELLWARYFPNGSLGEEDIVEIQKIINKYLLVKRTLLSGRDNKSKEYLNQFLTDLMTSEIEETLSPAEITRDSSYMYYVFQILKDKVKITHLPQDTKDMYLLTAIDQAYRKSDRPYQRYHLFIIFYKLVSQYSDSELMELVSKFPEIFKKIDEIRHDEYVENLQKFVKRQLPPFLILFELINQKKSNLLDLLSHSDKLWTSVDQTCRLKYQQVKSRLRGITIKSLIYVFLTKMLLAIILEYPVSLYLYGEVNTTAIIINSIFPPLLMLVIIFFFKLPGEENTKKIYERIVDIIDSDQTFETRTAYISNRQKTKRPYMIFAFSIFYSLTFLITLYLIYLALTWLNFNLVSKGIFIFFVSVISFFSYRIKYVVNEYKLEEREGILTPIIDFFFIPILTIGKFLTSEVARFNFFAIIFDFIIEAPFKLLIQVVEDWITFVRARKEEIG